MPEPISVGVNDAASMIGVSRSKLYELIKSGEIKTFEGGGRTLIKVSDLRAWVDARPPR